MTATLTWPAPDFAGLVVWRDGDRRARARESPAASPAFEELVAREKERRAVLHLHFWMGHTVAEIGELLDLPAGTVKSHLHRARETLREELGDHDL